MKNVKKVFNSIVEIEHHTPHERIKKDIMIINNFQRDILKV